MYIYIDTYQYAALFRIGIFVLKYFKESAIERIHGGFGMYSCKY